MNITIKEHKELGYVISVRELHQSLNTINVSIEKILATIKRFHIENEDYIILTGSVPYENGVPRIDYLITLKLAAYILRCNITSYRSKQIWKCFMLLVRKERIKEKIENLVFKLNVVDERLADIYSNNEFTITFK